MNRPVAVLCALAFSAGALFAGGRTLWQDGGVKLCGTSADQPMVAVSDSSGGAIVVWADAPVWPYYDTRAQRVNADGLPLWTENGVLLCASTGQNYLDVVADGMHGAIATWSANGLGVQRVSADGVPLWGPSGVTLRPLGGSTIESQALFGDGHGGAIVVWNAASLYFDPDTLIACRVDGSGDKKWETVIRVDTLDMASPCLCSDGEGGLIVAWQEYETGVRQVRVQRLDSTGATRWGSTGVRACTLSTTQAARACLAVGSLRFVVGWFGGAGTWQHRAQMFDSAGNRLWELAGVPVSGGFSSNSGSIGFPVGRAGQTAWVWTENRTGTGDFYAQKLDSTGSRCWETTGVWLGTSDTSATKGFSATSDERGGAIAVWTLNRSRLNWDVYAQHVDSASRLCWSDTGLAVCPGPTNVLLPVVVRDGAGGAITAWLDDRGLYAQRATDMVGVEETPSAEVRTTNTGPTVVRGVLFLDGLGTRSQLPERNSVMSRAALLDASGRKVLDLHSGANDVRALAPGVYFVRTAPAQAQARAGHKPQTICKVVLVE